MKWGLNALHILPFLELCCLHQEYLALYYTYYFVELIKGNYILGLLFGVLYIIIGQCIAL